MVVKRFQILNIKCRQKHDRVYHENIATPKCWALTTTNGLFKTIVILIIMYFL